MIVIEDILQKKLNVKTFVALGSFDGLHIGHRKLIEKTVRLSKENYAESMVITFKNHPLSIINPKIAPKLLISNEKKKIILKNMNVDILNLIPFDEKFMKVSPEDFIYKIISLYNVSGVIVGFNYRFGYKNMGDVELLKALSRRMGFKLFVIDPVSYNGKIASSSYVRNLIESGEIETANNILTRSYSLSGEVIHGRQIGRTLNFPTANLGCDNKFLIPKGGVYYTNVKVNNGFYKGITNIGVNPTVNGRKLSIETNLLDFDDDIYGKDMTLYFISRIRSEKKFESVKGLEKQLQKDKIYAGNQNFIYKLI